MEFGDKTHIAVVTLSMKNRTRDVFLGAVMAFALVDGASVLLGGAIAGFIDTFWINLGSGCLFLLMGIVSLRTKDEADGSIQVAGKSAFLAVFGVVAVMELGDKTQLASMVLSAKYGSPIPVFWGIVIASSIITASGVVLGRGLLRIVPLRYLRYVASCLFVSFGILFLMTALLGIEIM